MEIWLQRFSSRACPGRRILSRYQYPRSLDRRREQRFAYPRFDPSIKVLSYGGDRGNEKEGEREKDTSAINIRRPSRTSDPRKIPGNKNNPPVYKTCIRVAWKINPPSIRGGAQRGGAQLWQWKTVDNLN